MRFVLMACLSIFLVVSGCAVTPPAPQTVTATPTASTPQAGIPGGQSSAVQSTRPQRPVATGTLDDARRHMLRGMAAIEMSQSEAELAMAEDEFRMATEIAPQMANAWYNLGSVQGRLGNYQEAIHSYQQYLAIVPDAQDAQRVRDDIVKLEFRQEMAAKTQARVGLWVADDGTPYDLTLDGNRITLKTNRRPVPEDEVRSTYSLVGNVPISSVIPAEYQLTFKGDTLSGTWSRGPVIADKCTVPAETAQVNGELLDQEGRMILKYSKTSFLAATQMSILTNDFCREVKAIEKKDVVVSIYGPLGRGGLGVVLDGLTSWWDGGFSLVHFGWQGRLAVTVPVGSLSYEAGLRDRDEILAIDGVAVKSLSAGEVVAKLRGEPGTEVTVEVWREDVKDPFPLTIRRVEVPTVVPEMGKAWVN